MASAPTFYPPPLVQRALQLRALVCEAHARGDRRALGERLDSLVALVDVGVADKLITDALQRGYMDEHETPLDDYGKRILRELQRKLRTAGATPEVRSGAETGGENG